MLGKIKNSIRKAMSTSGFFSNFRLQAETVDISPFDRDGIVKAYREGLEVRTVIDKVAKGFAMIPTKWVDSKTGEDIGDDHWRAKLLRNPNPLQVQSEYETDFALQYLLFNECFIDGGSEGIGLKKGERQYLRMIQGQYVGFKLDKGGNITQFVNSRYQDNTIDVANIKAVIGPVLDPIETAHATPKLYTATKLVKKLAEGHQSEADAFRNNGVAGIISAKADDTFNPEQGENMQRRLNDPRKANKLEFTSGSVDYHDISRTPVDLGILESSKDGRKALATAFDYPLPLISDDASTYNNANTAERSVIENNFIPFKELYCLKMNEFLDAENDNVRLVVDTTNIKQLQSKPADLLAAHALAKTSVNERRKVLGLATLDGDEYDQPILAINDQLGYAEDIGQTDLDNE